MGTEMQPGTAPYAFKLSLLTGTTLDTRHSNQLLVPFLMKLPTSVWKVMSLRLQLQWKQVNHTNFSTVIEFVFQGTVQNYCITFFCFFHMFGWYIFHFLKHWRLYFLYVLYCACLSQDQGYFSCSTALWTTFLTVLQ